MSALDVLRAELGKTATLPGVWTGAALAVLAPIAVTVLNASTMRAMAHSGTRPPTSAFEAAYFAAPLSTVGAVVIGIVALSSEYTPVRAEAGGGRQVTTTLSAVPQRLRAFLTKSLVVALLVVGIAAVTIPVTSVTAHLILGDLGGASPDTAVVMARALGATLYWTLSALMSLALTAFTRSGVAPLVLLIANSSVVSFSLVLTKLTSAAFWLPDLAGVRLLGDVNVIEGIPARGTGAVVMTAWTVALLVAGSLAFVRRDA